MCLVRPTRREVAEDGLPYRAASWHMWRDQRVFVPFATIQNWVEASGAFRWGVAPFPRGRRHVALLFSEGYGIRRNCASPEAAWSVAKAFTSPSSQARLMELGVRLPANRTVHRPDAVTDLFRRELACARLAREAGILEVRYLVEAELEALWDGDEPVERICGRVDHGVRMIMRGRERNGMRRESLDLVG